MTVHPAVSATPSPPSRSLDEWVEHFHHLYFPTQNRERTTATMFAHLVEVVASLNKSIFRRKNFEKATKDLAKVFAWYCALWDVLDLGPLSESVFQKFPDRCLYCKRGKPCGCSEEDERQELTIQRMQHFAELNREHTPSTLQSWARLFGQIYPVEAPEADERRRAEAEMRTIMSRLLEELGEVSEAARFSREQPLEIELEMADVLAWICKVFNCLPLIFRESERPDFDELVHSWYPDTCRKCHKAPCQCWIAIRRNIVTVIRDRSIGAE